MAVSKAAPKDVGEGPAPPGYTPPGPDPSTWFYTPPPGATGTGLPGPAPAGTAGGGLLSSANAWRPPMVAPNFQYPQGLLDQLAASQQPRMGGQQFGRFNFAHQPAFPAGLLGWAQMFGRYAR